MAKHLLSKNGIKGSCLTSNFPCLYAIHSLRMKRTYLGEFEEIVLLTVAVLEGRAYGVAITHEIIEQTGRQVRLNQ